MFGAYSPGRNLRDVEIFTAHRRSGQPAQHRDLPDVRQRIGNRPLKQLLGPRFERAVGSQIVFECFERGKEAVYFVMPCQRLRIAPLLLAARDRQCPIEKIPDVRQDLSGRPRAFRRVKIGECVGAPRTALQPR